MALTQDLMETIGQNTLLRIQKLLTLAKSDNESEAANAMAAAMSLLAKNELSFNDIENLEVAEEIDHEYISTGKKRLKTWKYCLLRAIADANFCNTFMLGPNVCVIGKPTNKAVVNIMYQYLVNIIEQSTLVAFNNYDGFEHGKTFCNNFKQGMVSRLSERLAEEKQKIISENAVACVNRSIIPVDPYKKSQEENDKYVSNSMKIYLTTRPIFTGSRSGAGYNSGRESASNIPLSRNNALNSRN